MDEIEEHILRFARQSAGEPIDKAFALARGLDDSDDMPAPDKFVLDFFEIVEGHRSQFELPGYNENVGQLIDLLDTASASIRKSFDIIPSLSRVHRTSMWHLVATLKGDPASYANADVQVRSGTELNAAISRLNSMSAALRIATGERVGSGRKGRKDLPYVSAASEFILCWLHWIPRSDGDTGAPEYKHQHLSEARTVAEKWIEGGREHTKLVPSHQAARFVEIGLALIDPAITTQNAVTSYNNGRKLISGLADGGGLEDRLASLLASD